MAGWDFQEILECLDNYPILDEIDYETIEHETVLENIEEIAKQIGVKDNLPADWVINVYVNLPDNELENNDGYGTYPSEESIKTILERLQYVQE